MYTADALTIQYLLSATRRYDLKIQIVDDDLPISGAAEESYIYVTSDDFIYVTSDDFIYDTNGYTTITQDSGTLYPIKIDKSIQPTDGFTLGSVNADGFTMTIKDTVEIPRNAKLAIFTRLGGSSGYGDWIPMGVYYVDNRYPNGTNLIKYTCFNEIIKSEVYYVSALSYPTTAQAVWDEIMGIIGGQSDTILPPVTVNDAPTGDTCRIALSDITAMCGGSLIINREGKYDIVRPCDNIAPALTITTDRYFAFERIDDLTRTITKVTCIYDDEGNYVSYGSDDGYNLIFHCRLINESSELEYLYNLYNGIEFTPFKSLSWIGDPRLDLGDLVEVIDNKTGQSHYCYVMTNDLDYGGGLSSTIASPIKSTIESEFGTLDPKDAIVRRIETKVSINTTSITANSENIILNATEITNLDGRVTTAEAEIIINANQISLTVTEVTNIDGRLTTAEAEIIINAGNIELKVSEDGVIAAINISPEIITISASKVELSGYVTFTNLAIEGQTVINGGSITTGEIDAVDVRGVNVYGSRFYDSGADTYLELSPSATFADLRLVDSLGQKPFEIYDNVGSIDIRSYNTAYLTFLDVTDQGILRGDWRYNSYEIGRCLASGVTANGINMLYSSYGITFQRLGSSDAFTIKWGVVLTTSN